MLGPKATTESKQLTENPIEEDSDDDDDEDEN